VTGSADTQGVGGEEAGASARLFVALPVPTAVRHHLELVQGELRGRASDLRFTRPEGWHVTLTFLGWVGRERIGEVGQVVGVALEGTAPITLSLGQPGRFGNRVLWIGLEDEPAGAVAAVGERLQSAIEAAGLPVERQEVRPHLTLARGGRGRPVRARSLADLRAVLTRVQAARDAGPDAWVADEVQVWRSELGRGPARYHVITGVPLRG
jgi:RNA 2',3'-cyclic 3'-phosphodiesterase